MIDADLSLSHAFHTLLAAAEFGLVNMRFGFSRTWYGLAVRRLREQYLLVYVTALVDWRGVL
jgi:hypothetical protein